MWDTFNCAPSFRVLQCVDPSLGLHFTLHSKMRALIGAAKLSVLDPEAYLRHVLNPIARIEELLPWNVTANCNPQSRLAQPAGENTSVTLPLPRIAEFIDYGQITLGEMDPIGGVAIANDDHNTLATLVRKEGETFAQLLTRLDQATPKALDEDIFTELKPPQQHR
jgi:hypothetical protein